MPRSAPRTWTPCCARSSQRDPAEVFASFNYTPIASASIAQVHEASLHDGTNVVVKVQRPKLPEIVAADLRVLHILARLFERLPLGDLANPVGVVEDFEANLQDELDFRREAANLDEFNAIMVQHGLTNAAAPKPHHELSSARVLVMERFYGDRIDDQQTLLAAFAGTTSRRACCSACAPGSAACWCTASSTETCTRAT